MHTTDLIAYAASIGYTLTERGAGLVTTMVGMSPTRPSVDDLNAWIARFAS